MNAKKSSRRVKVLEAIFEVLTNPDTYDTLKYDRLEESRIKQYLYPPLRKRVAKLLCNLGGYEMEKAKSIARHALRWEGDKQTTVNNFMFFGVQHRPDFDLDILNTTFAVEIKMGQNGDAVRSGIGQSLVYTTRYDFCAYLFIDTSPEKRIANAFTSDLERVFVEKLWSQHNVMFKAV